MKNFKQYNESLRDKMTPVSGEDMRKLIGDDDIYENVYKVLEEKVKEFKPPFSAEISFAEWSPQYITLRVSILDITYIFKIEDDKWKTFYSYGRDNESKIQIFETWDESYQNMLETLDKYFNNKLESEKAARGYIEERINEIEDTIQEINKL